MKPNTADPMFVKLIIGLVLIKGLA